MAPPKKPKASPKSPEELAKRVRKGYNIYLNIENYNYLEEQAKKYGGSPSRMIDEAIANYIARIKDQKND